MPIISYSDFMQGLDEALKDLPDTTDITYEVWSTTSSNAAINGIPVTST